MAGNVLAQDLKIGYLDTARVLKDAPQKELAKKKLKEEFDPRSEKIVSMQKQLKKLSNTQDRNAKIMSKPESIKLERKIVSLKRDIKRANEEFNEDFNLRRNEELAKLHKQIKKATVSVAESFNYDIILSDNVLYNSKRIDITDKVLKRLQNINSNPVSKNTAK